MHPQYLLCLCRLCFHEFCCVVSFFEFVANLQLFTSWTKIPWGKFSSAGAEQEQCQHHGVKVSQDPRTTPNPRKSWPQLQGRCPPGVLSGRSSSIKWVLVELALAAEPFLFLLRTPPPTPVCDGMDEGFGAEVWEDGRVN